MTHLFRSAVVACALSVTVVHAAQPADTSTTAVFAGGSLIFDGLTVTGGPMVANGTVFHNGGSLAVPSLYGGGGFIGNGGAVTTTGDVLFNGTIQTLSGLGGNIAGNVTSATGSVYLRDTSHAVAGNVTAAGNVFQSGATAGSVVAGGNVIVDGTVNGNVTYGGTYTRNTFGSVAGTVAMGGPVSPTPFTPLSLPAAHSFAANNNNITLGSFETRDIAPGTYGTLDFAGGSQVNLTAGDYTFKNILSQFSLHVLSFDTTNGPIRLFIDGDLNLNFRQLVNGKSPTLGTPPTPGEALSVLIETKGSFVGNADVAADIFAPTGDVVLNTFGDVIGRVRAGGNVFMNGSNTVTLPEPALTGVVAAAAGMMLRRRRA